MTVSLDRDAVTKDQPVAHRILASVVSRNEVSPAYLFCGSRGLGKLALARQFVTALLCENASPASRPCRSCPSCRMNAAGNHPDVHLLEPVGDRATISIEQIRKEVRPMMRRRTFTGRHKILLVPEANRLTREAQNAMLKILEDPLGSSVLVLVTASLEPLLPTVRSRCVRIPFRNLSFAAFSDRLRRAGMDEEMRHRELYLVTAGDVELAEQLAGSESAENRWMRAEKLVRQLIEGTPLPPVEITRWAEQLGKDREEAVENLALILVIMRGRLLSGSAGVFADCVDVISQTVEWVETYANRRLAIEVALVKLQNLLSSRYN
ncbi:MAG: DNA polymerase III subunit [Bacillota bacterium]